MFTHSDLLKLNLIQFCKSLQLGLLVGSYFLLSDENTDFDIIFLVQLYFFLFIPSICSLMRPMMVVSDSVHYACVNYLILSFIVNIEYQMMMAKTLKDTLKDTFLVQLYFFLFIPSICSLMMPMMVVSDSVHYACVNYLISSCIVNIEYQMMMAKTLQDTFKTSESGKMSQKLGGGTKFNQLCGL